MRLLSFVLASASLLSSVVAQTAPVAFTYVPAVVIAGSSYNITWGGGDGSYVTLTLRKGDPENLRTIAILADGLQGFSYLWNVSDSLQTASDYALQITQGQSDINYSGRFSLVGGTGSSTVSYSGFTSTTSSRNSTSTMTGMAGNSTMMPSNSTANHTTTTRGSSSARPTNNSTTGIAGIGGGATESATDSAAASATTSAPAETTTPAESTGGAAQLGSSVALVVGIVAAVMGLS